MSLNTWHLEIEEEWRDVYVFTNGVRSIDHSLKPYDHVEFVASKNNNLVFTPVGATTAVEVLLTDFDASANRFCEIFRGVTSSGDFMELLVKSSSVVVRSEKRRRVSEPDTPNKRLLNTRLEASVKPNIPDPQPLCLDTSLSRLYIGRFTSDVRHLMPTPDRYLCRAVNATWVRDLKTTMKAHPAPTTTIFPCLIDPDDESSPGQIDKERLSGYRMYALGGNHITMALRQLSEEGQVDSSMLTINADVYVGLTTGEARRIGNLHNVVTRSKPMSFAEEVTQARTIIYDLSGRDIGKDEPPTSLTDAMKVTCRRQMAKDSESLDTLHTTFSVATWSKRCWKQVVGILAARNGRTVAKRTFRSFFGMNEEERYRLLTKVFDGELTLDRAARTVMIEKKLCVLKEKFIEITRSDSWEHARLRYPKHTEDQVLRGFINGVNLTTKRVSAEFLEHCISATHNQAVAERVSVNVELLIDGLTPTSGAVLRYKRMMTEKMRADLMRMVSKEGPLPPAPPGWRRELAEVRSADLHQVTHSFYPTASHASCHSSMIVV